MDMRFGQEPFIPRETVNKLSFAGCAVVAPLLTYCLYNSYPPEKRLLSIALGLGVPFALWWWIHMVFNPGGFGKMPVPAQWALVIALVAFCLYF